MLSKSTNTCPMCHSGHIVSVINEFDGLLVKLRDGCGGKDAKQNGTGMTTGAVFAFSVGYRY